MVRERKNINMVRPFKEDLCPKVPDMYQIPRECGKVYIGQTGRSIEVRRKEHIRHLQQRELFDIAEHSINTGHHSTALLDLRVIWTTSQRKQQKFNRTGNFQQRRRFFIEPGLVPSDEQVIQSEK